jgi:predicted small integral membrane protein
MEATRTSGARRIPRFLLDLGTLPVAAGTVVAINAVYIGLVAFGNITDYDTNEAFVHHVLAMDTINFGGKPGENLDPDVMWRAMKSPALQTASYIGIIAWECLTTAVLGVATGAWLLARRHRSFDVARRLSTLGLLMLLALFMGGFITLGGEWFQMWRSAAWNGLEPAFRNSVLVALGLVLCHLPSPDWGAPTRTP